MTQGSVDASMAIGDKAMLGSHGNKKLVPEGHYGPGEVNNNDAYLVNTGTPNNVLFLEILTPPNQITGSNGVARTIGGDTPITYTDGGKVGNSTYHLYFVGCEYDQVEVGDKCVAMKERESGTNADYRIYLMVMKPQFMGGDSWSG